MAIGVKNTLKESLNLILKNKILFLPAAILLIVGSIVSLGYYDLGTGYAYTSYPLTAQFAFGIIALLFFSIVASLWSIHLSYSATKKKISLGNSFNVAVKSFLRFFAAVIAYIVVLTGSSIVFIVFAALLVGIGSLLPILALPAVILVLLAVIVMIAAIIHYSVRLLFFPYSIVIDNQRWIDSLKKSWRVTHKKWWMVFGIGFILGLTSLIIALIIYSIFLPQMFSASNDFIYSMNLYSGSYWIAVILVSLFHIFFNTWGTAAYAIAYLKLKKIAR